LTIGFVEVDDMLLFPSGTWYLGRNAQDGLTA
jgi:hypothetical protein